MAVDDSSMLTVGSESHSIGIRSKYRVSVLISYEHIYAEA